MTTTVRPESEPSVEGDPSTAQAARRAARIHLVVGPVGAGKSTFAARLAQDHVAVRLTLDEWMAVLFRPDRPDEGVVPWYIERAARCTDQIWTVTAGIAAAGGNVVLEIGLLRRVERERFYERVRDADLALTIHVLDAAREVRRVRVEERNRVQGRNAFTSGARIRATRRGTST